MNINCSVGVLGVLDETTQYIIANNTYRFNSQSFIFQKENGTIPHGSISMHSTVGHIFSIFSKTLLH